MPTSRLSDGLDQMLKFTIYRYWMCVRGGLWRFHESSWLVGADQPCFAPQAYSTIRLTAHTHSPLLLVESLVRSHNRRRILDCEFQLTCFPVFSLAELSISSLHKRWTPISLGENINSPVAFSHGGRCTRFLCYLFFRATKQKGEDKSFAQTNCFTTAKWLWADPRSLDAMRK